MTSKFALVIANTEYQDRKFEKLTAPGNDAEEFAQVLHDIAGFNVQTILNKGEGETSRAIALFLKNRNHDDLVLIYFSGHGLRDDQGKLYLAVTDTDTNILGATGIPSGFITGAMDESNSQRQILILDCCNSGAFAHQVKGAKSVIGRSMGMVSAFSGFGRVVLTATDATQYAWEGDRFIGNTSKSLFTHFLIEGLRGEADQDGDGCINVDELYDYVYDKVKQITPKQTPGKWSYKQQGEIILCENLKPRDVRSVPLPPELLDLLSQSSSNTRWSAIQDLIRLMDGNHPGLARAAQEKLQEIANNDDSSRLREIAREALKQKEKINSKHGPAPTKRKFSLEDLSARQKIGIAGGFFAVTLLIVAWILLSNLPNPPATPTAAPVETHEPSPVTQAPPETLPPETEVVVPPTQATEEPTLGQDGMVLISIPEGEFQMGSSGDPDEMPVHTVKLDAYWIDRTEVTNRMYAACVASRACDPPGFNTSLTRYKNGEYYFGNSPYDDYPVIYVDWQNAKDYCDWAGRRLPTEAEWEKAANWNETKQSSRKYPWGNTIDCSYANFRFDNLLCVGDTTAVEDYPLGASYYGVLDMAGNVWEWVLDRYDPQFYSQDEVVTNPTGPRQGNFIVIRGGSFLTGREVGNRSADREKVKPTYTSHNLGFRCAMDENP